jgi:hypothetical protein
VIGVKQALIGARRTFVIRDLLIVTKNIIQIGNVIVRIKVINDSTVNIYSIGVTIRPKKTEAINSTKFHNN